MDTLVMISQIKKSGGEIDRGIACLGFAFCTIKSSRGLGRSKLCTADRPALQRLPLRASRTQSCGRRFKLLGYVDRGDDTKTVKADGSKSRAALDLLASLPLSVMFETSFTNTNSPVPTTQNGNLQVPQDMSLFLSGAWTSHVAVSFK